MTIRKRKANNKKGYTYEVRFIFDDHGIKKRYSKAGFEREKDAKAHEALKKAEFLSKGGNTDTKKTLNDVYKEWCAVANSEFQPSTIAITKRYYENQVMNEDLGKMKIQLINYLVLQDFFNKRNNLGIEGNKNFKTCLNRIFKFAMRCEYISVNHLSNVIVSGVENTNEHKQDVLTEDQLLLVIQYLKEYDSFNDDAFVVAILISYYLGLRVSESLAVEKSDFDFEKNEVFIHRKLIYQNLKKSEMHSIQTMKNKASKATIPLPDVLKEYLIEWFKENPYERVVCDANGLYVHPRYINQKVNRILKRKKLDFHFHYHELRHTFSTNLYYHGVDMKVAQELMRHASINTTMNVYTHLKQQTKVDVINAVFNKNLLN